MDERRAPLKMPAWEATYLTESFGYRGPLTQTYILAATDCALIEVKLSTDIVVLGPVVRTPLSANPGLNFNPGLFFFLSKALTRIIFSIFLAYPIIKLQAKRIQLNWLFKLSYLSSKFALTLGYLNPASNNPALFDIL